MTAFARLLPPCVAAHAADRLDETGMTPEEARHIAAAVPRRRAEFATVRRLARRGMRELGLPSDASILPGPSRAPRWPPGVVGSLTHCAGLAGAAVALADRILGIGIDAEPAAALPVDVAELVLRPEEREWLADRDATWSSAVFSAKEAVYKTWHPLTGRWLDFHDAVVRPVGDGFEATLRFPLPLPGRPAAIRGRWALHQGIWLSAIAIPAE